jgi:hypothetical protein
VSKAVWATPPKEAEIVTRVSVLTAVVVTVNVAVVAPAGTVMLAGTLAAPLLLESATCAPPVGAAPLSVTVPVGDCVPPVTLAGFSVSEETVGSGGDVTLSVAVWATPPKDAETVTVVDADATLVVTVKLALVAPAATVTLESTVAAVVLLLESATCAPPEGAGPLNVTVPVEEFPPVTLVGFNESEEREMLAGTEDSSKSITAGLGSFSETATNFEGEII